MLGEKTGNRSEDAGVRWPPWVLITGCGPHRTGSALNSFSHPEDFGKTEALGRRWAPPPRGQRLAARVSHSSGPRERPQGTNPTFKCVLAPRLPLSTDIDAGSDATGVVKGRRCHPTWPDDNPNIYSQLKGGNLVLLPRKRAGLS